MLCPICQKSVTREDNPYRPFCSERCKMIDLDNWFEGRYRVPARVDPGGEDDTGDSTPDDKGESD